VRKKAQDILALLNDDDVYDMERKRAAMLQRSVRSGPPPPADRDDEAPAPPPEVRPSAVASAPVVVQFDLFEQRAKRPEEPFDPWQQTPKPVDDLLDFEISTTPPPQESDFLDLSGPNVPAQKPTPEPKPDVFAEFGNLIDLNLTDRPQRSYGRATQVTRGSGATLAETKAMK
jgi:hypothetical protein